MSAPVDTLCPPLSHPIQVPRGQQISGGPRGPNRCPATQPAGYNVLSSTCVQHFTFVRFISHTPALKELDEARVWQRSDYILVITNISPGRAHAESLMQIAK
jgi:hypothetical protein